MERPPTALPILADHLVDTLREPLLVLTTDLRVLRANRSFYRTFAVTPQETDGRPLYELGNGQWDIPDLRRLLEGVLPQQESFDDFEVAHDFPSVGRKVMLLNARRVAGDGGHAAILLAIEDVTERRRLEGERRELETRFTSLVKNVRDHSIFTLDPGGHIASWNVEAGRILGFTEAEALGRHFSVIFTEEDQRNGVPAHELRTALSDGRAEDERWHVRKGGERFWALGIVTPTHDAEGGHTGFSKILRDMTLRKRAEEAIRESERRFRGLAMASAVVLYQMSADWSEMQPLDGKGLVASNAAPIRDWLTRNIPESEHAAIREGIGRSIAERCPFEMEHRVYRPDGSIGWTRSRAVAILDEAGGVVEWVGAAEDITARKRAEEALRESQERLAFSVEAADLGTFYCPMPLGRIVWNDKCKEHFFLPPDAEVDFDRFYSIIHPEDRERTRRAVEQAVFEHGAYDTEYRTVSPDGRTRWVRAKGRAYYDADGNATRFDGVTLDITAQKQAEADRLASERRFREMADTAPAMLWVTEPDGQCSFLSRGWYEFTGQTEREGLGFGWTNAAHPDDREAAKDAFVRATRDRTYYEIDFRVRRADGEYRWAIDAGRPRFGPAGEFLGFVGSVIDIHDRKLAEEERHRLLDGERAARSEAERASRMKDKFLATLSHELRTPLNAILGWSQILTAGSRDEADLAEGLAIIERNARAQTQIIEDLLDMSRIISGKVRLDVQRLDLADVVRAAVETVRLAAEAKGVRLRAVLDPLAGPVSGDPNRLQQVFWNLLTNAVKFTPRGGQVQVLVERVNSHLEVSVIDTGEGIKPEFLPHVFDRFRQADASTMRRHGGLGLGLAIVKQLVELHGGSVRAKSGGVGMGSTFVVSIPLTVIHAEAPTDPVIDRRHPVAGPVPPMGDVCSKVAGLRVLVVDDEPDARALVERFLTDCDAVVTTAGSAREALDLLRAERPDVVVSDIGMPNDDGYWLIAQVRALGPEEGGETPAIALTAYARAEDRMRAVMAGFQHHVVKPVEPAELITMVASLVGRKAR